MLVPLSSLTSHVLTQAYDVILSTVYAVITCFPAFACEPKHVGSVAIALASSSKSSAGKQHLGMSVISSNGA